MSWIISVGIALLIILIVAGISHLICKYESLEEVFIHLILDAVLIILFVGVVIIVHQLLF